MRTLLLAFLLIAPLALVATPPASAACRDALGVPCGRIYPIILISTDDKSAQFNLSADHPLDVSATITFRFDMVNEGYTATQPNDQITMTFEELGSKRLGKKFFSKGPGFDVMRA